MSWDSSASGAWLFLTFTCIKNIICEFSELFLTFVVTSSRNCGARRIQSLSRVSGVYSDPTTHPGCETVFEFYLGLLCHLCLNVLVTFNEHPKTIFLDTHLPGEHIY